MRSLSQGSVRTSLACRDVHQWCSERALLRYEFRSDCSYIRKLFEAGRHDGSTMISSGNHRQASSPTSVLLQKGRKGGVSAFLRVVRTYRASAEPLPLGSRGRRSPSDVDGRACNPYVPRVCSGERSPPRGLWLPHARLARPCWPWEPGGGYVRDLPVCRSSRRSRYALAAVPCSRASRAPRMANGHCDRPHCGTSPFRHGDGRTTCRRPLRRCLERLR